MMSVVKKVLITEICAYIKSQTDVAVIGLSGGADSTLVAALCKKALGPQNVYGISMPYSLYDKEDFNYRSESLATYLDIWHQTIDIKDAVNDIAFPFAGNLTDLSLGNIKSRVRMINLYTMANILSDGHERVRVIGTGNLSEDWIGYDTKGGDALADFFPIGELVKSEVYELIDYLNIPERLIDRVPSAGLEDGQTDEQDLGYSYDEMAPYVLNAFNKKNDFIRNHSSRLEAFIHNRHIANKHKHEAPPVASVRWIIDK